MKQSKKYSQFTYTEIEEAYSFMRSELAVLPENHPLIELFYFAWNAFRDDLFSYDGATFVKERNNQTLFEVASFIHDFRNSCGYVGENIDNEFLSIMITLNYKIELIIERYFFMRLFTWLNVLRHKYWLKDFQKFEPVLYYQLPEVFINPR